jgi:hypothetical protein
VDKKTREKDENHKSKSTQEDDLGLAAEDGFGAHNLVHP